MITKYWHYSMISTDIILRLKVVRNFTSQNLKHESWTIHRLQHNLHGALRNRSSSANVLRNPNKYHPLSLMMCTTRDQCSFTILNTSNVTIYNIQSHETTLCSGLWYETTVLKTWFFKHKNHKYKNWQKNSASNAFINI